MSHNVSKCFSLPQIVAMFAISGFLRVLSKRLEPVVWEDVRKIILDRVFAKKLLDPAKQIYLESSEKKDVEGLKAKIHGNKSKNEALTERLGELPKGVSASPIYKQMEKLERLKGELEAKLLTVKNGAATDEKPVEPVTFEAFLSGLRLFITEDTPPDIKAALIKKLVSKVKVKPGGVDIEYFVGEDYFIRELEASASGSRLFLCPKMTQT